MVVSAAYTFASRICSFRKLLIRLVMLHDQHWWCLTNADGLAKHMEWGDSPVHVQESSSVPSMTIQSGKE